MTNIGPLTATLTPSPGCMQTIWGQVYTEHHGQNSTTHKYHSLGRSATSECYPSGFQLQSDAYYSPGICPSGWASACGSLEVIGTVTETRATCCPRGYSCIASPSAEETWSTLSCSSAAISPVAIIIPNLDNQVQEITTTLGGPVIHAAAINIRWQKNDFLPTATTTDLIPAETGPGTTPTSPAPENGVTSLSTAAKVGIGISAAAGLLLVFTTIAYLLYRRRKHNNLDHSAEKTMGNHKGQDPTVGDSLPEVYWGQEVHGYSGQEMATRDHILEMNGYSGPAELHGSGRVELVSNQEPVQYHGVNHH